MLFFFNTIVFPSILTSFVIFYSIRYFFVALILPYHSNNSLTNMSLCVCLCVVFVIIMCF